MASCTIMRFLQLGEVGAHVQVADELALVGDGIDQVQRGEPVEAMLVSAALDGLLLPFLDGRWSPGACVINRVLAAGVVHEHALLRVDQQRFFDVRFDAQRADQRFGLAEVLAAGWPWCCGRR